MDARQNYMSRAIRVCVYVGLVSMPKASFLSFFFFFFVRRYEYYIRHGNYPVDSQGAYEVGVET